MRPAFAGAVALSMALLAAHPASAACTHFVDVSIGSDANPGTSEVEPWESIVFAAGAASPVGPGDTVCVKDGDYPGEVEFEVAGASGNPLTFQAYPGHSPRVVFDGSTHFNQCFVAVPDGNVSWLVLDGFECVPPTLAEYNGANIDSFSGMAFVGVHDLTIRNNIVHPTPVISGGDEPAPGILVGLNVAPSSNITIEDNYVYGVSECIYIGSNNGNVNLNSVTNVTIHGNTFVDCRDEAVDIKENVNTVSVMYNEIVRAGSFFGQAVRLDGQSVEFAYNSVCDSGATGSDLSTGIAFFSSLYDAHLIHHNYFIGQKDSGDSNDAFIRFPEKATSTPFEVTHNTFIGSDASGVAFVYQKNVAHILRDNAFVDSDNVHVFWECGKEPAMDYNGYDIISINWCGSSVTSLTDLCNDEGLECNGLSGSLGVNASDGTVIGGSPLLSAASDGTNIGAWQGAGGADCDGVPGECGDGNLDIGEECDDGNTDDDDGCDSNCTPTGCGNGIVTSGETCDDGNTDDGDCCSSTCTLDAQGAGCDDGNLCTTDDACDGAGACAGNEEPAIDCLAAGMAKIDIRDRSTVGKDSLLWQWKKGPQVDFDDFDNPVDGTTDYALCIYDHDGGIDSLAHSMQAPAGGTCRGRACWKASAGKRIAYRDRDGTPDGIQSLKLKAGVEGKPMLKLKAKGSALVVPPLPFTQNPSVLVQLKNSTGGCWSTAFDTSNSSNEAPRFKAKY